MRVVSAYNVRYTQLIRLLVAIKTFFMISSAIVPPLFNSPSGGGAVVLQRLFYSVMNMQKFPFYSFRKLRLSAFL